MPKGLTLSTPACRVTGIARPGRSSNVRFEVWLPLEGNWNGKYVQLGTGGFAGRLPYANLFDPLARGYAVGITDGGHVGSGYTDASFALRGKDAIVDYAHRAQKSTRDAAQAVLVAWSAHSPAHSYFVGCSNGGREALMLAQRYPSDFDGIVAGAPASHLTGLFEFNARVARRVAAAGQAALADKLPLLQRAALATCSGAEAYIPDPQHCSFDPSALACAPAASESASCLTADELAAVGEIRAGFRDAQRGYSIRGPMPGAEALPGSWGDWLIGGTSPEKEAAGHAFARNFYAYFVRRDPDFELQDLKSRDIRAGRRLASLLDATDPDLRAFKAGGGKLIQYHGWNDPGIPADTSLRYHEDVSARLGDTAAFYRLFMVPGMLHCGGGMGPFAADWLGAIDAWVERGQAPDEVVAVHPASAPPGVASTQRLVPFEPRVPREGKQLLR